jgi:FkbH-like protein
MKVLIISDITLETLNKKQFIYSDNNYTFIFCEDLLLELNVFEGFENYNIVYIHIDNYFKRYRNDYLSILLNSVLNLSNQTQTTIALSNLFFGGWSENSLFNSCGVISNSINDVEQQVKLLLNKQNVYFIDVDNLIREIGVSQTYNYTLGHLYQLPYTKNFLEKFATYIDRIFLKISSPDKKVIILDCDNTLWKGVVGEDGLDGVLCDLNADGIIFYHFQQFLKSRKAIGFILCLCSKNNEDDVKEVFLNKRMPLQWDDFVIKKVNWSDKDINIKEIANELNLGADSFIFIDDNEFEINIIKEILPEVSLFKMTTNYHEFNELVNNPLFFKKSITEEDFVKTEQYISEANRKGLAQSSLSFGDYIKSLEIKMKINEDDESDLLRISQLTEKTNQFNFNKKYYTVEELRDYHSKGLLKYFTLRVCDKFGDYGLVGVILVKINKDKFILENYILSCRILGRSIEFEFIDKVQDRLKDIYNSKINEVRFIKTAKNVPAQIFYKQLMKTL